MNKYTYSFQNFQTIHALGGDIYNGAITLKEADQDQSDLLVEILNSRKKNKSEKYREKTAEERCS